MVVPSSVRKHYNSNAFTQAGGGCDNTVVTVTPLIGASLRDCLSDIVMGHATDKFKT